MAIMLHALLPEGSICHGTPLHRPAVHRQIAESNSLSTCSAQNRIGKNIFYRVLSGARSTLRGQCWVKDVFDEMQLARVLIY